MRKNKNIQLLALILGIIGLFMIFTGSSYAFFSSSITSKDYVMTTGNLQLNFSKKSNEINLTNTYPLSNVDGLATEGYSFDITNNGSISTKYQLRLELDPNNTIPIEYIRLSYVKTKENGVNTNNSLSEPVLLSDLNATYSFVKDEVIEPLKTDSYTLKLWIDFSAPNDIQGKTFKAKIVIDSLQNVEDGYVFNSTRPIITLNKFSDGNTDQVIPLNSQFVDPGVLSIKDDKDILTVDDVTVTGSVDTSTVGVYDIAYSVTDSANNTTTVIRTIAVGDEKTLNIKRSVSDLLLLYPVEQLSSSEAIFCSILHATDDMYLGCHLYNKVEDAFNEHTRGIILLTNDSVVENTIQIATSQNYILELNGKKIESAYVDEVETSTNADHGIFNIYGNFIINDSVGTGGIYTGTSYRPITASTNSNVIINGGNYNGRQSVMLSGSNSYLEINGGNFTSKYSYVIFTYSPSDGINEKLVINDGVFTSTDSAVTSPLISNQVKDATIVINSGTFTSESKRIISNNSGDIIINNGTYTVDGSGNIIGSFGTGNVTVNDGTFVRSGAGTAAGIYIDGTGILTINGGTFTVYTVSSISNAGSGTVIINNGTINSIDKMPIYNSSDGTIYITGGSLTGKTYGIYNKSVGIVNICGGTVKGTNNKDLYNEVANGKIYYKNTATFTNGLGNPTKGTTGTIALNNNLTCSVQ